MKQVGNTLYVTQEGAWVHKDGMSIVIHKDRQKIAQFPVHAVSEIVCFGFGVSASPALVEHCAKEGVTISYLDGNGRFLARMQGPTQGNVLLRRAQYRASDDPASRLSVACLCVAAKIQNQRNTLLRFSRNHPETEGIEEIRTALAHMERVHGSLTRAETVDSLRGMEGEAAEAYFSVFDRMILVSGTEFRFASRSRRPPLDRVNALLSYTYSILALDLRSALECVGLDPFVGFLHVERPGRPSLALDLMEEFRSAFADRLVLGLVNLRQVDASGFVIQPTGEVEMKPETRKILLTAYQKRKREILRHPFLDDDLEIGVVFLAQARLLARHLRGDLPYYPAFLWR